MKRPIRWTSILLACWLMLPVSLLAQGAGEPLTLQGLHQSTMSDVRGRGMGGAVLASSRSASAIFSNPALLTGLEAFEIRAAGMALSTAQRQSQEWTPNRLYAGLSLLMEDKWDGIKDPLVRLIEIDPITFAPETSWVPPSSPYEQLQKPLDDLGPNWSRSRSKGAPLSFAAAMPIYVMEMAFVVGVGAAEAFDLTHYFQNNNVLDPLIGSYRPQPMPMVRVGDTAHVRWYQHTRQREGSIYTVAPSVAFAVGSLSIGITGQMFFGSSDDLEQRRDRGTLNFINNSFKVDTVVYAETRMGTSTYEGAAATIGAAWESDRYELGLTIALPLTITRLYERTLTIDTALTSLNIVEKGEEKLHLPLRAGLGLVLTPTDRWSVSFDYVMTGFARSEQTAADGSTTSSWVGTEAFRLGAEYLAWDWLSLRSGYRQDIQPFAVVGSAILDEPVRSSVLTFGLGTEFMGVLIDAAYEYTSLKYQDMWQSNVNYNLTEHHRFMVEVGYRF